VVLPLPGPAPIDWDVHAISEDRKGDLWLVAGKRLVRLRPDGRLMSWEYQPWLETSLAQVLMEDRDGRLWLGSGNLCVLDTTGEAPVRLALYRSKEIPPLIDVQSLYQDDRGDLWAGGFGLAHFEPGVWRTSSRHRFSGRRISPASPARHKATCGSAGNVGPPEVSNVASAHSRRKTGWNRRLSSPSLKAKTGGCMR